MSPLLRRPCIAPGCTSLAIPGTSRCITHQRQRNRAKNTKREGAPGTGAARRFRRGLRRKGVGTCAACGSVVPAGLLEVDHILPLVDGGRDVETNLQTLCRAPCHRDKTSREAAERAARRRR